MAGECRALGQGPSVFFDGRTCIVRPRDNQFDGFLEAEAIKARGNPLDVLLQAAQTLKTDDGRPDLESLSHLSQVVVNESKTWRYCSSSEKNAFASTPYGQAVTLWYCLRHNFEKDWTLDRVRFVMGESMRAALNIGGEAIRQWVEWKDGLFAAIDQAGGEDLLGNLTGLRLLVAARGQQPDNSSDDSARSTDTPPTTSDG